MSSSVSSTSLAGHKTPRVAQRGKRAGLGSTEPLPTQGSFPQPDMVGTGPSYHFRDVGMGPECWIGPRLHLKADSLVLAQPREQPAQTQ